MNWIELSNAEQLHMIKSSSHNPDLLGILIFKHSTRCAISSMAVDRLERLWDVDQSHLPTYFLDLLSFSAVSDEIASLFDVKHESPQVLVIKNGVCIYSASHNLIFAEKIAETVQLHNK